MAALAQKADLTVSFPLSYQVFMQVLNRLGHERCQISSIAYYMVIHPNADDLHSEVRELCAHPCERNKNDNDQPAWSQAMLN